jgi:exo-poly-alpha-galacturonosidase
MTITGRALRWRVDWRIALAVALVHGLIRTSAAQSDGPVSLPGEGKFVAPPLARTASTVLLLWERFSPAGAVNYEILCDGAVIASTENLSYTASHLAANHPYRFAVRAIDATGRLLRQTAELVAATRPAGTIFNVRNYGAFGDGRHLDTAAIQQAIDRCTPGGTVLVPAGSYRVGHLDLKSDLTLDIVTGATLQFLDREEGHYVERPLHLPGPDGPLDVTYGALITGLRTNNVTVTGGGTIQANGDRWWPHFAHYWPKVFEVVDARNLFVQGITVVDPPSRNMRPLYVDDVIVANVTFVRRSPLPSKNGDDLDLDSCRNALVVGCSFGNQDDSISLKSGEVDGTQTRRQRPCENVVIRDCRFDGELGPGSHPLGLALGSEVCGGLRHVLVKDCDFVDVASLADIKANRDRRHGVVDDVLIENCRYRNTVFPDEPWNRAPISIDLFYYNRTENPDEARGSGQDAPSFGNIRFRNITIDNPRGYAVYITGLAERPIEHVTFTNVIAKSKLGLFARNIDGLMLDHVVISPQTGPAYEWGKNVTHLQVLP